MQRSIKKDVEEKEVKLELKQEITLQNVYQAPNPYPPQPTGFKILDVVINGVTSIPNKIFGGSSSIPILPAQMFSPISLNLGELKQIEKEHPLRIQQMQVLTYDKARLDTLEVSYRLPKEKNIYIIKFNGNGARYEADIYSLVRDAERLKATVVAFNYRGVGHSKGKPSSKTRLVTDGIAEVQRLLDQGIDPHHIVLDGHSLGGGIATLVAKHFHDLGMRVNLFNDRSFSSVSSAGARILAEGRVRESMVELLETSTYSSVVIADWAINAADAYNAIPANCKGYMYVDAKCEDNKGDGVIPHKASLHKALEGVRGQSGNRYRMFAPTDLLSSGHNARRVELISPDLIQTGEEIFDQFVKRVTG